MSVTATKEKPEMNGHSQTNGIHKPYQRLSYDQIKKADQIKVAKIMAFAVFVIGVFFLNAYIYDTLIKLNPSIEMRVLCGSAGVLTAGALFFSLYKYINYQGGFHVCSSCCS